MKVVIDTNIMFSALIVPNPTWEIILFGKNHSFYTPNFAFVELYEKKEKVLKYTKRTPIEFREYFERLVSVVQFVRDSDVTLKSKKQAYEFCQDIDEKDIPFLALPIEFQAPLWTGDKTLKNGLFTKGYTHFFNPE